MKTLTYDESVPVKRQHDGKTVILWSANYVIEQQTKRIMDDMQRNRNFSFIIKSNHPLNGSGEYETSLGKMKQAHKTHG